MVTQGEIDGMTTLDRTWARETIDQEPSTGLSVADTVCLTIRLVDL